MELTNAARAFASAARRANPLRERCHSISPLVSSSWYCVMLVFIHHKTPHVSGAGIVDEV